VTVASIAVLTIQVATIVPMYWTLRYWDNKRDPRPGVALSGLYCIAIVSTGTHYAVRWQLVGQQDTFSLAMFVAVIAAGMLTALSFGKVRDIFRPR